MGTKIGNYLKKRRETRKITLRQVESETGINNAYLSQLENGKILKPSPEILHKLADVYRVPYHMLLEMTGYPVEKRSEVSLKHRVANEFTNLSSDEEGKLIQYLRFLRSQEGSK